MEKGELHTHAEPAVTLSYRNGMRMRAASNAPKAAMTMYTGDPRGDRVMHDKRIYRHGRGHGQLRLRLDHCGHH